MSADPVVALFAERLRRERLARHWSLRDLAGRSGISSAGLSKIENAQADPRLSTVARIAGAFGVPIGEMVMPAACGTCDAHPPGRFICPDCGRGGESR